jgi:hypothetical protein
MALVTQIKYIYIRYTDGSYYVDTLNLTAWLDELTGSDVSWYWSCNWVH